MKIIVAPDSFKGNMSAAEACEVIRAGIMRADADAVVYSIPLADGGEGTARAVTLAAGGRFIRTKVRGPLGDTVEAAASIGCGQIGLDAMIADSRRDLAFASENLIRAMQLKLKSRN